MAGILIASPHADDETLGCGGMILKLAKETHWMLCTKEDKPLDAVKQYYNFTSMENLLLPDGQFDQCNYGDIVKAVSMLLEKINPEMMLIPYMHDIHTDHKIIAAACLAAAKPFRNGIKRIWAYEVISQTNLSNVPFCPNMFVDISEQIQGKLKAVELYGQEMIPGARSSREVESLAVYRGTFIGAQYAEAFMVIRDRI